MAQQEYAGKDITIFFDDRKCIHSRNCVLSQPEVFRPNVEGPWIAPDNAGADELAAVAHICPSGAITYERHDGGEKEKAAQVNTVRLIENGPLVVSAEIKIDGNDAGTRATLCRCGKSKNKPYCDGSHLSENFVATGELESQPVEAPEKRDGPLEFSPVSNGPLLFNGPVEVIAGSGRKITCADKGAFCRCGASNNKPFCDGTHKKIGFKAG